MSFHKYTSENNLQSSIVARHAVVNHLPTPVLRTTFFTADVKKKIGKYEIAHSRHSQVRSSQRGFSVSDLLNVIEFGEQIERQGMIFHIINAKNLPQSFTKFFKDKWQEWVVVTDANQSMIITCYKAHGALKRIKRKVKTLINDVK